MDERGELIRKYHPSRAIAVAFAVLGVIIAGVGVLAAAIRADFLSGGSTIFAIDPHELLAVQWGGLLTGAGIVAAAVVWALTRRPVCLYENGVVVHQEGSWTFHRFDTMRELYAPLPCPFIAFRSDEDRTWVFVSAKLPGIESLVNELGARQAEARLPVIQQQFQAEGSVFFRRFTDQGARVSRPVASRRWLRTARPTVEIGPSAISVNGRSYPITETLTVAFHPQRDTVTISDAGRTILKASQASFISLRLMITTLEWVRASRLQEQPSAVGVDAR